MSDELDDLLKRVEILSNEKYEASLELRLQKDLETKAQALAASRLELLREANKWLDVYSKYIYPDVANYTRLKEFMDRIAEELGDERV